MDFQKKKWRLIYALYVPIYLIWFFWVEGLVTMDSPNLHVMNTWLDDLIPFSEFFIIPYGMWFFYILGSCVLMFLYAKDLEFNRFALSIIVGMSICTVFFQIYPSCTTLRPDHINDNLLGRIVTLLYSTDTSTNVFPSIHVYDTLVIHIGLLKCDALKSKPYIYVISWILCIAICLSTMFLKQHAIADVIGAIVLTAIMYVIIYIFKWQNIFKKRL